MRFELAYMHVGYLTRSKFDIDIDRAAQRYIAFRGAHRDPFISEGGSMTHTFSSLFGSLFGNWYRRFTVLQRRNPLRDEDWGERETN